MKGISQNSLKETHGQSSFKCSPANTCSQLSTAVAVAIGLVLCNVMQIGAGFVMESTTPYDAREIPSVAETLMNIIPTNPFNALSTQNLLQIIFFALLLHQEPRRKRKNRGLLYSVRRCHEYERHSNL